jgi:acyl-[acyl carrier protein]--UDP-N-acetylglucosamine O-acyltransferase
MTVRCRPASFVNGNQLFKDIFPSQHGRTMLAVQVPYHTIIKGTVSRGLDGLFVVGMDRALIRDEPLIVIKYMYFLIFNFEFYFLQKCCKKVTPLYVSG